MKKLIAASLAVIMGVCSAIPAFAAEQDIEQQKTELTELADNMELIYIYRFMMTPSEVPNYSQASSKRMINAVAKVRDEVESYTTAEQIAQAEDLLNTCKSQMYVDAQELKFMLDEMKCDYDDTSYYSAETSEEIKSVYENAQKVYNGGDEEEINKAYIDMRNLFNKLCGNVTVAGDVDNSGVFDISDITYIQKYLAGAIQLTTAQRFAAGINLTGNINTVTNYQKNLADIKSADGTGIEYTGSKITYFKNNYSAIGYDIEYYSPVTESTNYIYYADRYKDNSAI